MRIIISHWVGMPAMLTPTTITIRAIIKTTIDQLTKFAIFVHPRIGLNSISISKLFIIF